MPALRERIAGDSPGGRVGLGFHLLADTNSALLAAYEAMAEVYRELAEGFTITSRPLEDWKRLRDDLHGTIGLDMLIRIEKATVEKD